MKRPLIDLSLLGGMIACVLLSALLYGCGTSSPRPPTMKPIPLQAEGAHEEPTARSQALSQAPCLQETKQFYKRAWRSIEDYLKEIRPLVNYLSALDGDQVGQRLHRAHYMAEFQEQVFQRFRLMERATDRCDVARPHLLRYREELVTRLTKLL